ncbi:uncharacterized protein LOC129599606 [Paramacrobiotus metropolitanus]|uniref:uncharacterized protein LOC129599606 n=1 Tax=Paramacrobiotus metropolitanus TaxID=2943436 RepID=UPI00244637F3|nr:uncharacterized protein LOC129599606 [Paramacrobiotus metropolitanus]
MLGPHPVRELLPSIQIRPRLSLEALEMRTLQPGHFQIRTCSAARKNRQKRKHNRPARFPRGDVERISRACLLLSGLDETVRYLQRKPHKSLTTSDAVQLRLELEKRLTLEADSELQLTTNEADSDGISLSLPPELLTEIFLSLDTIERQRLRRTCCLWEEILTSPVLAQDVRQDSRHSQPGFSGRVANDWSADFALHGCIIKCMTAATRTVCLRDRKVEHDNSMEQERCLAAGQAMVSI